MFHFRHMYVGGAMVSCAHFYMLMLKRTCRTLCTLYTHVAPPGGPATKLEPIRGPVRLSKVTATNLSEFIIFYVLFMIMLFVHVFFSGDSFIQFYHPSVAERFKLILSNTCVE